MSLWFRTITGLVSCFWQDIFFCSVWSTKQICCFFPLSRGLPLNLLWLRFIECKIHKKYNKYTYWLQWTVKKVDKTNSYLLSLYDRMIENDVRAVLMKMIGVLFILYRQDGSDSVIKSQHNHDPDFYLCLLLKIIFMWTLWILREIVEVFRE